jgi:GNAT superfamily N-acetyltransferase
VPASVTVRPFEQRDVPRVLELMQELAVFEGYDEGFAVTQADLKVHGLEAAPRFGVFVAEIEGEVIGIAVNYVIPWTYDLKPTVVLKELFVAERARGAGAGEALFRRTAEYAASIEAPRLNWTVLPTNNAAKRFYEKLGGANDAAWEHWTVDPRQL